jgi:hypothetical protein
MNGIRCPEPLQGVCNDRMKPTHDREPVGQHALEDVEPLLGRGELCQLVAHRDGSWAPEIFKSRVPSRELAGMDAKQDLRGTWAKHRAHGAERRGDVSYVEARSRPTDDHRAYGMSVAILLVIEQA